MSILKGIFINNYLSLGRFSFMLEIIKYLKARYVSEKAQGILEYALILAFVVVVAAAIQNGADLQTKVSNVFSDATNLFDKKAAK